MEVDAGNVIVSLLAKVDGFKSGIDAAVGKLNDLKTKSEANSKQFKEAGLAIGGFGAAVTSALGLAAKAAADEETVFTRLRNVINASGGSWESSKGKIDDFIVSMQATTQYGDTDMASMLNSLVIYTGDVDKAMLGAKIAMDMAASGMFDAGTASKMVGMAMTGNIEILGRYIPEFRSATNEALKSMDVNEKAAYAIEVLTNKFGGLATGELNTANGMLKQFGNYAGDLVEIIGQKLLPVIVDFAGKLTDVVKVVISFAEAHPKLTENVVKFAAALGLVATAVGALLIGAASIPMLLGALSAIGVSIGAAGPVGLAIAGFATALFLVIKYWDELSALVQTTWQLVLKPTLLAINQLASFVFKNIELMLMPLIDYFIEGWTFVKDTIFSVFEAAWNIVKTTLENIYGFFRLVLSKLGVELPEISELFGDIGEAGGVAADEVKSKWNAFKEAYKANLKAEVDETKLANAAVVQVVEDTIDTTQKIQDADRVYELEANRRAAAFWSEEHGKEIEAMLADETEQKDKKRQEEFAKQTAQFDAIEKEYGKMLTAEELDHAQMLAYMGEDWKKYVEEVTKPTWFETTFNDMYKNFNERLGNMGDAWMKAFTEGNFKNGISFVGKYLKSTFESAFMDIGGSILQSFVDKIKEKLIGALTDKGITGALSGVLGSISGGGGGAAGAAGGGAPVGGAMAGLGGFGLIMGASYGIAKLVQSMFSGQAQSIQDQTTDYLRASTGKTLLEEITADDLNAAILAIMGQEALAPAGGKVNQAWGSGSYAVLKSLWQGLSGNADAKNYFLDYGGTVGKWAKSLELDKYNYKVTPWGTFYVPGFHTGGIIPGLIGQEKLVRVLAGEEIITRSDPRHSVNFGGGINVNVYAGNINSNLDARSIGKMIGDELLMQVRQLAISPV